MLVFVLVLVLVLVLVSSIAMEMGICQSFLAEVGQTNISSLFHSNRRKVSFVVCEIQ